MLVAGVPRLNAGSCLLLNNQIFVARTPCSSENTRKAPHKLHNRVREKYLLFLAEAVAKNALMPAHFIVIIFHLNDVRNYRITLFNCSQECSVAPMNFITLLKTKSSICLFTIIQFEKVIPYHLCCFGYSFYSILFHKLQNRNLCF